MNSIGVESQIKKKKKKKKSLTFEFPINYVSIGQLFPTGEGA